jgi:phenylacetate-coenzyme A ligase PaaK-like adenylate-forming protein
LAINMREVLYRPVRRAWWALQGSPACQIASLLDESQWWPRRRLEEFRDEKFRRLIEHCYHHVPYYRGIMDERDLRPTDIQSAEDLPKLPVLTKEIVRANWQKLRADNIADTDTFVATTGGSTGEPMRTVKAIQSEVWANICFERGKSWGGLTPGRKHIVLKGGSLGDSGKSWRRKMITRFSGRIDLLAYDLRQDNVHEYIKVIRGSRSQFIVGYASNIYHLARMLLERKDKLDLRAVFTTAECLLPSWTRAIRQAMNCKVYSYYGCGECNSLGYQCQEGDAYHISEEHAFLEIEYETGRSDRPKRGQALITDLDNYAMPLLRYENGDYLTTDDKPCACGRSLRLISKLEGRTYEFLLSKSRGLVSAGICDVILGNITSIAEFQVRQDGQDHIRVLVVPCQELTKEDRAYIRESFRYYLGETMDVEIELVSAIARTKAEKLQTAVNELL